MLFRLMLVIALLTGCSGVSSDTLETAWNKIENGAVVIDVRTPQEYQRGHLRDAELVPYTRIGERIDTLVESKDRAIVLYCHSGRRSGIAARELERLGYTDVLNAGGLRQLKAYRQQQAAR